MAYPKLQLTVFFPLPCGCALERAVSTLAGPVEEGSTQAFHEASMMLEAWLKLRIPQHKCPDPKEPDPCA